MEPSVIEMTGFTNYAEATVDLSMIQLAALVGPNGSGKSSVIDALLWALFGESTKGGVKAIDQHVRTGATECRVAYEFTLHDQRYRIVRHRTAGRKTMLELYMQGRSFDASPRWDPISSKTISETQADIERLIRMDYRMFTATALILQGKSDSLTGDMTDAERKDVLARILGLDLWDTLQERARELARSHAAEARVIAEQGRQEEVRAAERPAVEAEIAAEESRLGERTAAVAATTETVTDLEARVRQAPTLQQRVRELQTQIDGRERDQVQTALDSGRVLQGIGAQEALLGRRAEIEAQIPTAERAAGVAGELVTRLGAELAEAEAAAARTADVDRQMADVDQDIAARQRDLAAVKADGVKTREQEQQALAFVARAAVIRQAAERSQALQVQLVDLDARAERWPVLDGRLRELRAQSATWASTQAAEVRHLQQQVTETEQRAALLVAVPCTGTSLQLRCQLLASAQAAAEQLGDLRQRLAAVAAETDPHAHATQGAIDALEALQYSSEVHVQVRRELADLQGDAAQLLLLEAAERQLPELKATLDGFAARYREIEAEIKSLQVRRTELAVALGAAAVLRQRVTDARSRHGAAQAEERTARDLVARLRAEATAAGAAEQAARVRIGQLQEQTAELAVRAQSLQTEIERLQTERQAAEQSLLEAAGLQADLATARTALSEAQRLEAFARERLGRLRQTLVEVERAEAQLQELRGRAAAAQRLTLVCETLARACSQKGGVPALIVEGAVPQIEALTNDFLGRMAGGRLAVRLDTQTEGKSTGTMQEVLRITVLDSGAERPYQTYSGAERFMVDLSLRVALSKFLCHRAGGEIRFLVLDEGLGSLDAENRPQVMTALQEAAREFGRVIVVTHIAELQDALPQRIEVTRGANGSTIKVVA